MASSRNGFTVRIQRSDSAATAGGGFVVDDMHIITFAHVVNLALGRDPRAQETPDPQARVQVDFPMAGGPASARARSCAVQAWVPPPSLGLSGGDVASLVLVDKGLPERASPARLTDPMVWDLTASVFGYPGDPPKQTEGAWAEVKLRGMADGRVIRLAILTPPLAPIFSCWRRPASLRAMRDDAAPSITDEPVLRPISVSMPPTS